EHGDATGPEDQVQPLHLSPPVRDVVREHADGRDGIEVSRGQVYEPPLPCWYPIRLAAGYGVGRDVTAGHVEPTLPCEPDEVAVPTPHVMHPPSGRESFNGIEDGVIPLRLRLLPDRGRGDPVKAWLGLCRPHPMLPATGDGLAV